ncbi:hypothetical protein Vretimale_14748 [Volvox reticuliferus]|uniref:Uncharacterized protein n=1 Tax=Volvox reticuliferus TaxID=1737510 RepID=A0A8J4LUB2_9CHLO|nr:hypothetical protein Vretimale_14748 [Volvox reticuliferus]
MQMRTLLPHPSNVAPGGAAVVSAGRKPTCRPALGGRAHWPGHCGFCTTTMTTTTSAPRSSTFGSSSCRSSSSNSFNSASAASGGGGDGLHDPWKLQQLQSQVFELKQRLVEAEVKRQAAEKVAVEVQQVRHQLQRTLAQTRWLLAAVALLLLLTTGVLAWAELEAPPLGTMVLSTAATGTGGRNGGPSTALAAVAAVVVAAGRCVAGWVEAAAQMLSRRGVTF